MRIRQASITIAIVFIAVCLIIGCGGGGGGGTSGNGGNGGGGTTQVESVVAASPTVVEDPLNIMVADTVTFQVIHYDNAGVRTVVPAGLWSTTDTLGTSGTLDPSTGNFTATTSTGAGTFVVSTTVGGTTYHITYKVTSIQSRLTGHVLDSSTGVGIPGITVQFFDAGSTQVGVVTSSYDGSFQASVPTTTKTFNLDPNSISPALYYRSFSYIGMTQGKATGTSTGQNGSANGTSSDPTNGASSGTSTGSNTTTTLNNTGAGWTASGLIGYSVTLSAGTGNGQTRTITGNTSTTLTVSPAWTVTPDGSSAYTLNSNILIDNTKSWTVNGFANYSVKISTGTGSGQSRSITSNTATKLTLSTPWVTTPDNTSVYVIDSNIFNDLSGNWIAGELNPRTIFITSGTGFGESRLITGNTGTKLTVSPTWDPTPDSSSVYQIGTLRYSPTVPCSANVPKGLANGVTTAMPGNIFVPPSSLSPPGPPNGCG